MIDLVAAQDIHSGFGITGFLPIPHTRIRKRRSYARGSVILRTRKKGPDVWVFLYRKNGIQKTLRIGDTTKCPTKTLAQAAVETLKKPMNYEFGETTKLLLPESCLE